MFKKVFLIGAFILLPLQAMAEYSVTSEEVWAATFLHEKGIISNSLEDLDITQAKKTILYFYSQARNIKEEADFNIYPLLEQTVRSLVDGYRLGDTITRKEMAKIVTKLAGANPEEKCNGEFKDVEKDWGCKYIERMLKVGYIQSGEKFRPNDNITKSEAIKLIFKARGLKKIYNTSNWQEDYAKSTNDLGLVDIYTDYGADAKRGWIFELAANTIKDFFPIQEMSEQQTYSDEAL